MKEIKPVVAHKKNKPLKSALKGSTKTNTKTSINLNDLKRPLTSSKQLNNEAPEKKPGLNLNSEYDNNKSSGQNSNNASIRPNSVDTKNKDRSQNLSNTNIRKLNPYSSNNSGNKNNYHDITKYDKNSSDNNLSNHNDSNKIVISPNFQNIINNTINNIYIQQPPNEFELKRENLNSKGKSNTNTIKLDLFFHIFSVKLKIKYFLF